MKTTNVRTGTTYVQSHTRTERNGFTTLQKTGDGQTDSALRWLEDGLSYLYYSDLGNQQGVLSKEEDRKLALGYLRQAILTLEATDV